MSWDKPVRPEEVKLVPGRMEVERYIYTPGIHGVELSKALMEGRMLGMKCGDDLYVPPLTFCPDHSEGELVELEDVEWVVETYTIVQEDMYGGKLEKPQVIAFIKPRGAKGGIIHYLNVDPSEVRVGMRVEPVFRRERRGLITDIEYFKPVE
ncbi:MAG: Zn-ribbon domain-containing OB-fold protein [Desulfurococcales archaeon]|nr:Zn-ribbon domain-containing OB-fold protein [Desulfurococcales archaeon]